MTGRGRDAIGLLCVEDSAIRPHFGVKWAVSCPYSIPGGGVELDADAIALLSALFWEVCWAVHGLRIYVDPDGCSSVLGHGAAVGQHGQTRMVGQYGALCQHLINQGLCCRPRMWEVGTSTSACGRLWQRMVDDGVA